MSAYLIDVIRGLETRLFIRVLVRAFAISGGVFLLFAWTGDVIFIRLLQVRFASFLVFGGLVFLIIAVRYMIAGANMIDTLRGPPEHLAGSIAMPFMIGPGTVSASVLTGARLPASFAAVAIIVALVTSCLLLVGFKLLHDWVKGRNEPLVERYVEIAGRVSALLIGTIAVEMMFKGVESWLVGLGFS
jgi:multiple antibiotic resistance protein